MSMSQLLLIQCVDQPGLIHQITGVLFRYQCNIISNHEFVDSDNNLFFMRTEFTGAVAPSVLRAEIEKFLPCVTSIRLTQATKRPVVVLATKEPHCLGDLLLRHAWANCQHRSKPSWPIMIRWLRWRSSLAFRLCMCRMLVFTCRA